MFLLKCGHLTALEKVLALALEKAREEKEKPKPLPVPKPVLYGENEIDIPVDFSFLQLASLTDAEKENPRFPEVESPREDDTKLSFVGRSLRLNNNELKEVSTLPAFVETFFQDPKNLGWIDLSFNALTVIDKALVEFKQLHILYLHGNKIKDLKEVDKLASLPKLRKLTLHGNPMEEQPNFKMYVTSTLPQLTNVSFSAVTKCEANASVSWKRMFNPDKTKKKKKAKDDDD
ncbi:leucine-rich repeat-containing protein 51-like isoform X2 [Babylonia areolata]|uniref:leucine-rich repeat-containing protein 51-like isoform X2 n=1 Tax=Babylonia areolata TaxID=304850 RepID=UPI003FD1E770